jgi:hypothetical protein
MRPTGSGRSSSMASDGAGRSRRERTLEPGVIATSIFSKAAPIPADSPYPHSRRQRALFAQSLTKPTSPYVVGDKIREIVDSDSWQLRYPVGPDAAPFLQWRASKTDEEVINIGASSDADYILMAKREFGLDVNL